MQKITGLFILLITSINLLAQPPNNREIKLTVLSTSQSALSNSTVSLLAKDSSLIRTLATDEAGMVMFRELSAGSYICRVSRVNHQSYYTAAIDLALNNSFTQVVVLKPETGLLQDVTVTAKKPFVQHLPDRTVVNVEAGITNAGSSVLEVLEKSPGVTVDRNGNISLKGRPAVQIMIDGKLTQLAGADLQNLLSGMNASQVDQIELIDNPSAKYDAAGNAGIINIKTKKNKQRGFNGSFTVAYGQGRYPKNNNNLVFNFRNGSFNYFMTYSVNLSRHFMDMYALRTYYNDDRSIAALLEQPYFTHNKGYTHTIRTGVDYFMNQKTTLGIALTGMKLKRRNTGASTALWQDENGTTDSIIYTSSLNNSQLEQGGINFNARHAFSATKELTADIDVIGYRINTDQLFENRLGVTTGTPDDASKGDIPSSIHILSGKADYSQRFSKLLWETGWKSSRVSTDNLAQYYALVADDWTEDLGKSNHFKYTENIHALYTNFETKAGRWNFQAGLRYEYTSYKATQLGNAITKDSSFNRNYGNLFPSAFITWQADSSNSFTLRTGRRIDRPAFQKLNPFVFIINKYTFQQGNPYFRPQFTWNFELSHLYKEVLSTTVSYNLTRDYISQVFLSDTSTGTIVYTEGNIGKLQNFGLTVSAQFSPASWWSLSAQGTVNHKRIEGLLWRVYKANMTQGNFSINNQFRFSKGWGAELSGFYITKNQNDIQEVLEPTGQAALGVSKQVFKNKGSLRLTLRDIFYTQAMAGLTEFQTVQEYFKLKRDTRVVTISFTFRFGKAMKLPAKRSTGGASDEIERVGTVN